MNKQMVFLSVTVVSLMFLSLSSRLSHKEQISSILISNQITSKNLVVGAKDFKEVRIVRSELSKGVFSDVIVKYQEKTTPCPTDGNPEAYENSTQRIQLLVNKYSI